MGGPVRPHGLLRLLNRFPVWMFRLGLGWLFGNQLVMITHTGRKTGKPRCVVVEIVRYDRGTNTLLILSGWGERSDWFRNMAQTPEVVVQVGLRKWPAVAARLSAQEAERELLAYLRRRPVALRVLARRFGIAGYPLGDQEQVCRLLAHQVPALACSPRKG